MGDGNGDGEEEERELGDEYDDALCCDDVCWRPIMLVGRECVE